MESLFPLLIAGMVGFSHAFEIDHLVAVSSLVTRRQSLTASLKDGVYWGLGHTSTILAVGVAMIVLKVAITQEVFSYLEAGVGVMLILLGVQRIRKMLKQEEEHRLAHLLQHDHDHKMAYGVGLVHGLAGSGALVLLVMSQLQSSWEGIVYLLIFGVGSIAGMLLASGLFSLPFSRKIGKGFRWSHWLTWLSSGLCIYWGLKIVMENLMSV